MFAYFLCPPSWKAITASLPPARLVLVLQCPRGLWLTLARTLLFRSPHLCPQRGLGRLVCWPQSEMWKFTKMHKQMFDLGGKMEQSLHQERRLFSEARKTVLHRWASLCYLFVSSLRLDQLIGYEASGPQHEANFNKSETPPLAQQTWKKPRRNPTVLPAGAQRGRMGKRRVVENLVRTRVLLGGKACTRDCRVQKLEEVDQRQMCPLQPTAASDKHPPALGFYPLLWPRTRQELPDLGHRLHRM